MPVAIPLATYRVQLSKQFGFDEAAQLVPYLKLLGISHLYASPFLKARPGSSHGYDITDHNALNPEFGGDEGFARLSAALAHADMGLILDFVPNHMGVAHADNAWWLDVLEWGPKSPYARIFDIDWETLPHRHNGGVLLPILGRPYGEALEAGEIELRFDPERGTFSFWYFEHQLPVRPDRYAEIVRTAVSFAGGGDESPAHVLLEIAGRFGKLRSPSREEFPRLKHDLIAASSSHDTLNRGLGAFRPSSDNPGHATTLHRLLERQHYRLAHWRVAISEINYRRFFDVNDLAGIRVEDIGTFRLIHRKVAELIAAGQLHGLRLDHIDGLYDPAQYCLRLRRLLEQVRGPKNNFYVVVEKILAPHESLPELPGVSGTTGYDVLNLVSRVLTEERGLPILEDSWQTAAAPGRNFRQIVEDSKRRVIDTNLASEFTVLVRLLSRIAAGHWRSRDYTLDRLRAALELFVVNFPVYRTYAAGRTISPRDRAIIKASISAAREQWYGSDADIFEFLEEALTLDLIAPGRTGYSATRVKRFAAKVQQFTGPVTAKAVEDTAFYRYHRLLALNEVGNDPALPALTITDFHESMTRRAREAPHGMTATATHDTKRGEDARMRLVALSELAEEWGNQVRQWSGLNAPFVAQGKHRTPSRAHEYMLYQALLGSWPGRDIDPAFVERAKAFALKAAREGKQETSWTSPNAEYEQGLASYIEQILTDDAARAFRVSFDEFAARTALLGCLNSLSQLILKLTIPGVPDFYQGTEFWDLSFVDPDNRRPVDFQSRRQELERKTDEIEADKFRGVMNNSTKATLMRRLLELRNAHRSLFTDGSYEPVEVLGRDNNRIIAFARVLGSQAIIVAVARHFSSITRGGREWPPADPLEATLRLDRFADLHDALDNKVTGESHAGEFVMHGDVPGVILLGRVR